MQKSCHQSSVLDQQYEEEINNLRTKIKSMEFQISDLKNFIINQKNLHAKELEQSKQAYENSLSQATAKHSKQIETLQCQLLQAKEASKYQEQGTVLEIANFFKNCSQQLVTALQQKVTIKLDEAFKKIGGCKSKLAVIIKSRSRGNQQSRIQQLKQEINDKNILLERQRAFMDKMLQEKKDSDQMYEKQLSFLEEVYRQRRNMCCRLQKVNSELQTQNNTIRQKIVQVRRNTQGMQHPTVCINLEEEEMHRMVKTSSHLTQPTERHTPKPLKKSTPKYQYDSTNNLASPLRWFKVNESKRLNSLNSPSAKVRSGCSISRHITKSTANIGKRISTKTIDIFCTNQLQINSYNRSTIKDKQNTQLIL